MNRLRVSYAVLAVASAAAPALAQTDQTGMARQMAANQLGVLEYCRAKGYADQSAVAAQKATIAELPASAESTLASENTGKQGTISANGTSLTLAGMARSHNTTEAALCQQMAQNTSQVASMRQKMGTMPMAPGGMPAVNGMPAMPGGATPGGIQMQGMPQMPATPASPPNPQ